MRPNKPGNMVHRLPLLTIFLLHQLFLFSQENFQDSTISRIASSFPSKISKKVESVNDQIDKKTEKTLRQLQKYEEKLKRQIAKIDSIAAHDFFESAKARYEQFLNRVNQKGENYTGRISGEYLPYLDSVKGSLSFLNLNSQFGSAKNLMPENINDALNEIKQFEKNLKLSEDIKQFIRQRKQQIKNLVSRYSSLPKNISRNLKNINKTVYYYSAQIKEYKEIFRHPEKMEQKALSFLNKIPAFRKFMKENSQLSNLFGTAGTSTNTTNQTGLQTRSQVVSFMQNQSGIGGPQAASLIQRNLQSAQGQISQLRNKLGGFGSGSGDLDMPDFKPNNQKTKTFFQRLEYGTNMQTATRNSFFPITTDLGLSLGYRLNDKNVVGVGASYKMGWGKDIKHINITSEGAGLRSFIDINIKKSFFISGGFEYNYQQPFNSLQQIYSLNDWSKSGLIGVSKIVSMNTKVFKKTKVQVLWDYLSYKQRPRTQAFKFRIGYSF